jgi:hypothetical protein
MEVAGDLEAFDGFKSDPTMTSCQSRGLNQN